MGTTLVIITVIFSIIGIILVVYGVVYFNKTPPPAVTPNNEAPKSKKRKQKATKPPPAPETGEYDMISIESDSELRLPNPVEMDGEDGEEPPAMTPEELEAYKSSMEKALMQREIEYLRKELALKNKEIVAAEV